MKKKKIEAVKLIEAYKCSDGSLYEIEKEALKAQSLIELTIDWKKNFGFYDIDADMLIKWLHDNRDSLKVFVENV